MAKTPNSIPELDFIARIVQKVTQLDIRRVTRKTGYVRSRWIYFQIAKDLTGYSYEEIGGCVNLDHASVSHGIKNFQRDIWNDHRWRAKYCACLDLLSEVSLPEIPYEENTFDALLNQISVIQERFNAYKKEVYEREKAEKPLLDIYRQMPQEQKDRLLFQAKTLLKVSEIMQKSA